MIEDIDSGLSNGLGVLDTLLVEDGIAKDRDLHFSRLRHDCVTVLRIPCPEFEALADNSIKASSGKARLRIIVSGGPVNRPLDVPTRPVVTISLSPVEIPMNPLQCLILDSYPRIAGMALENSKRTDYTRSYAARQDAITAGYDDAIMTNTYGNIACATTSNIFIVENGVMITPPLSEGVLAGIERGKLVAAGAREERISIERLMKADSVFLTNSITGPRPVYRINERDYGIFLPKPF